MYNTILHYQNKNIRSKYVFSGFLNANNACFSWKEIPDSLGSKRQTYTYQKLILGMARNLSLEEWSSLEGKYVVRFAER